ncbi:glycosyltransferase family 2 protein [Rothia mucilaginosa]|uniref:glycosyltransferase family 2 protein n=1 Tax=Rothia mucilaginosa TaxID=43675 RepID=UPI003CF82BA3
MAEKYSDVTAFAQLSSEQPSSEQSSSCDSLNEYPRTVAVVVTYNREDLLPKTLAGIASGERVPAAVVIVDNASTDGTAEYLRALDYELPVDCIRLESNMGGAGGFAVGIDRALECHNPDLVWVMDDDTEPTENTLSEAVAAWLNYSQVPSHRPAVVASRVVWTNGEDHPMNTPRTMFAAGEQRHARAQAVGARPIRSASFVSILMDAQAIRRNGGLPIAEFFIWNDDFEFSTRLIHHRDGIAVPSSVAKHHTKTFGTTNADPGPRFYNDVRNKLWVFTRSRTLNPLEKLLYGGSSARLWISTVLRTDDRRTYLGYFLNGVRDGLRAPRPNAQVLEGIYPLTFPGRYGVPASANAVEAEKARGCVSSVPDFSVLMSVYAKENPAYLDQALESNLLNQTVRPSELVLVKDGPLTPELDAVVDRWVQRAENLDCPPIQVVELAQNVGLAEALNAGLQACSYELVARADSDDLSEPTRFARLIPALVQGGYTVLGSAMLEVNESNTAVESTREAIVDSARLLSAMDSRNPIYHPSVAFVKSAVQQLGGYEYVPGAEDWWLWMRLRDAGYRLGNIPEALVRYRVGAGAYTKRGGVDAWLQDVAIQRRLYTGHGISKLQWAQNMAVRSVYRFVPEQARRSAFRALSSLTARASSRSSGTASEGGM